MGKEARNQNVNIITNRVNLDDNIQPNSIQTNPQLHTVSDKRKELELCIAAEIKFLENSFNNLVSKTNHFSDNLTANVYYDDSNAVVETSNALTVQSRLERLAEAC